MTIITESARFLEMNYPVLKAKLDPQKFQMSLFQNSPSTSQGAGYQRLLSIFEKLPDFKNYNRRVHGVSRKRRSFGYKSSF
ncbi:MAG: hypothetical protein LBB83_12460, partial [Treponema sp.]|nr:hypothetical protein [Treponema sp.]